MASALHQRFGVEFTGPLLRNMLNGAENIPKSILMSLSDISRERELKTVLSRQKVAIRILVELWLIGVFRDVSDAIPYGIPAYAKPKASATIVDPPPLVAIKEVLSSDLITFTPVSIIFTVVKYYGNDILGNTVSPAESTATSTENSTHLVGATIQARFYRVFSAYAVSLQRRVQFLARELIRLQRLNEKRLLKFGTLKEEYKNAYKTQMAEATLLLANCKQLFEILNLKLSDIQLHYESALDNNEDPDGVIEGEIWLDESDRSFYENPISFLKNEDLKDDVSDLSDEEDEKEDEKLLQSLSNIKESSEKKSDGKELDTQDDEEFVYTIQGKLSSKLATTKSKYDNTLTIDEVLDNVIEEIQSKLLTNPSKEIADECAQLFFEKNGSKARVKLLDFLTSLKPFAQSKLRYICRFIADIHPIAPGILDGVLDYLSNYARYLRRKPRSNLYATRIFVTQYISELVKFGLVPKTFIFHIIHSSISPLNKTNAQMVCNLLEGCGKYLYYKNSTHKLMSKYLDMIDEKKSTTLLSFDERMLIVYAIHYIKPPPPVQAFPPKERPVIEQYVRKLIYLDLNKETKDQILEKLFRLNWKDPDTYRALCKVFCKIWKVRLENIALMAEMLAQLKKCYYSFSVLVTDSVLEDIRRGLELGGYKNNQIRLSQAIYLGELAKQGIVGHQVIINTLYLMLTFGYPGNMPKPEGCKLDTPLELFRVRLTCTLLDTCGPFLNFVDSKLPSRGIKRELDLYMSFLQYYVRLKKGVSMDIEFQLRDTFKKVRPDFPIYETVEGAISGLEAAMKGQAPPKEKLRKYEVHMNNITLEEKEDSLVDYNDDDESKDTVDIGRDAVFKMPKVEKSEAEEAERQKYLAEKRRKKEERENAKAEDDLDAELQELMTGRKDLNPTMVRKPFDLPVPDSRKIFGSLKKNDENSAANGRESSEKNDHVKYALILKNSKTSGNNPSKATVIKTMDLPKSSTMVSSMIKQREEEEANKQRMNNLIMKYEYMSMEDDDDYDDTAPGQKGIVSSKHLLRPVIQRNLLKPTRYSKDKKNRSTTIDDIEDLATK